MSTRLALGALAEDRVLLHRWSLLCKPARLNELRRLLNQEELRRADRLISEKIARRFIAARAGLRKALAAALDKPPAEVAFEYGPMGKPRLVSTAADAPPHFNLAHSGDEALLAISTEPIGVDLEVQRPMPRAAAFAERWFHPQEQQRFATAQEADRLSAFFTIWTAKEASLKLLGKGVGEALPRILTPERDGWATELPANESGVARCWIERIDARGARAAIATTRRRVLIHTS